MTVLVTNFFLKTLLAPCERNSSYQLVKQDSHLWPHLECKIYYRETYKSATTERSMRENHTMYMIHCEHMTEVSH